MSAAPSRASDDAPAASSGGAPMSGSAGARVELRRQPDDSARLVLAGRLDAATTGAAWRRAMALTEDLGSRALEIDATGLDYCDGAGATLIQALAERQRAAGGGFSITGLKDRFARLLEMLAPDPEPPSPPRRPRESFVAAVGAGAREIAADTAELVAYVGEVATALVTAARRPGRVRLAEVMQVAERAGIGAVPIVALIGVLLGLILSFQAAIPMQRFGAEVFVADLIGLAMLRELGPLMAAIMLTARSGSAFAAELGTMTVNSEIDALTTMGLPPVRFLVVPRVLAALIVVPVLTMIMSLCGLAGSAVVLLSLGYPLTTFVNRVVASASVGDMAGGLAKALVFAVIVAAVGCMRGLQTGRGASAVGLSTTRAVVSGIVLVALTDGLFAVVFYLMGW